MKNSLHHVTNMPYHVWTDGSCVQGSGAKRNKRRPFVTGPGGWAAIIERGSDGLVLRGRQKNTTNVRMELRAAIEGLREVPVGAKVILHIDCTVIAIVQQRWRYGELEINKGRDIELWRELASQFERLGDVPGGIRMVDIWLIGKGGDPVHRRAHTIAGAEARALDRGLPPNATPLLNPPSRKERRDWMLHQVNGHTKVQEAFAQAEVHERARAQFALYFQPKKAQHQKDCAPGACVSSCPVWLEYGYSHR